MERGWGVVKWIRQCYIYNKGKGLGSGEEDSGVPHIKLGKKFWGGGTGFWCAPDKIGERGCGGGEEDSGMAHKKVEGGCGGGEEDSGVPQIKCSSTY